MFVVLACLFEFHVVRNPVQCSSAPLIGRHLVGPLECSTCLCVTSERGEKFRTHRTDFARATGNLPLGLDTGLLQYVESRLSFGSCRCKLHPPDSLREIDASHSGLEPTRLVEMSLERLSFTGYGCPLACTGLERCSYTPPDLESLGGTPRFL